MGRTRRLTARHALALVVLVAGATVRAAETNIRINAVGGSATNIAFGWNADIGTSFTVETTPFPGAPWTNLAAPHPPYGATDSNVLFATTTTNPLGFYRVSLLTDALPEPTIGHSLTNMLFVPDSGPRIEYAGLPNAGIDTNTGKIYLYYLTTSNHPTQPNWDLYSTSTNGMDFNEGVTYTNYPFDSRNTLLADGTWRRYGFIESTGVLSSASTDGSNYVDEAGIRYELDPSDDGWMGVNTFFSNPTGDVVGIYVGDKTNANNCRLCLSTNDGDTFAFQDGNVFGDSGFGGGGQSFVDPSKLLLSDGRVRIYTMRLGSIYSFISTNEAATLYAFEGLQLAPEHFTEFAVTGFFDPKAVQLMDGRIRIYAAANYEEGGTNKCSILSATTLFMY